MIRGKSLSLKEKDLNTIKPYDESSSYLKYIGSDLHASEYFRKQVMGAGYRITELYPIYYQGWDMDEWGAIGVKDGKKWVLETDHGSLSTPTEVTGLWSFLRSWI